MCITQLDIGDGRNTTHCIRILQVGSRFTTSHPVQHRLRPAPRSRVKFNSTLVPCRPHIRDRNCHDLDLPPTRRHFRLQPGGPRLQERLGGGVNGDPRKADGAGRAHVDDQAGVVACQDQRTREVKD